MNPSSPPGLPEAIHDWIRRATGAQVVDFRRRAGGGASREGAQLVLCHPEGRREPCYLTHDPRPADSSERLAGFAAEASAMAAVHAASVGDAGGMRVPRVIAWDAELRVMLTELVPGEALFTRLSEPAERERVAFDFMRQLAALHRLDVERLPLQGFPPWAPLGVVLRSRIRNLVAKHAAHSQDPLLAYALRWLERNLPADPPRPVLVHGDAGPANFLFENGRVTAVLDWEMTHIGDPMEDLAWIAVRDLFQPFVELPKCFAAYEAAGGAAVDLARVRWYRTYTLMTLAVDGYHDLHFAEGPYSGVLGNNLLYGTCHRRALIDGLAESMGLTPVPLQLPELPRDPAERAFEIVADDIRHRIAPHVEDAPALERLKATARVVRFWQNRARYGASFDAMQLAEINTALGLKEEALPAARAALVDTLLHHQVQREVALMKPAMGRLAERTFSPLEETP